MFVVLLDIGSVLALGEGLFMRMMGVATVTRDGRKASRLRLLGRTLLVWSPCAAGAALSLALWTVWLPGIGISGPVILWALVILGAMILANAVWAVWKPARGLPDLATGTWLVPR